MKIILILVSLVYCFNAKLSTNSKCENCLGKIHTKQDLQLTKQSLIIDKNQTCYNRKYKFLIIVKSSGFVKRNLTRSTWAKEIIEYYSIPILYAIGYPKDPDLQKDIIAEDLKYHDLLQFNILENYYNLTLKTTSVLLWYDRYCSKNSQFLLYVDDDVLIHVDKLIVYMHRTVNNDSIQGWFEKSVHIQREGMGGVSVDDFPIDFVPDYLWGAAVVYPSHIISNQLIGAIFNSTVPIFFRDDVFINGFMAHQAGIKREQMKGIVLYDRRRNDLFWNMIVIYFKDEESFENVWSCYKNGTNCNQNLALLLLIGISGTCLFIIIIGYCCKCFKKTVYCDQLEHERCQCFYEYYQLCKRNINLMSMMNRELYSKTTMQQASLILQLLINLRAMCLRIVVFLIVLCTVYYFLSKKLNTG
ncbi:unnamed protein product [Rotaria socialis]|uniref:Hexosyltransferase n=1 Tax=Rotaria socialis TaxID=392032 RepID=A0A818QPT1_9BILA|nr:unnamed protein product [Rotaria socialis]